MPPGGTVGRPTGWWAATGELLNGFDAALWLLCFFAIEGNILRHEHVEPTSQPRPGF